MDMTVPQLFSGKERDPESGLDYFGARYFSGAQGRFTSADPIFFQKSMLTDPQRFNLYSNEGNEPPHVHGRKGDAECKYWLRPDLYEIEEAWSYNLTPRLRREARKIIFDHFDLIMGEWEESFGGKGNASD